MPRASAQASASSGLLVCWSSCWGFEFIESLLEVDGGQLGPVPSMTFQGAGVALVAISVVIAQPRQWKRGSVVV